MEDSGQLDLKTNNIVDIFEVATPAFFDKSSTITPAVYKL